MTSGGRNSSALTDPESSLVEDFFEELDDDASGVEDSVAGKQSKGFAAFPTQLSSTPAKPSLPKPYL